MREYDTLKKVIIGLANYKDLYSMEPVNDVFKNNYLSRNYPDKELLNTQINNFVLKLKELSIEVYQPEPLNHNIYFNNQFYPRDIGFIIEDLFFMTVPTFPVRKNEIYGIEKFKTDNTIFIKDGINIEGGDVLVDDNIIFVGIGPRTDYSGVDFLKKQLENKNYKIITIRHKCIHLDCCMNLLGNGHLLICDDYLIDKPRELSNYHHIKLTKQDSDMMHTNVLSINKNTIIIDKNNKYCDHLQKLNYKLIKLDFSELNKLGGGFRCASLPLCRI